MSDHTLTAADLDAFARRVAINARQSLEAEGQVWVYLPCFDNAVTEAALAVLRTVVLHERMQANGGNPIPEDQRP